jgi:dihydrofolate reductase
MGSSTGVPYVAKMGERIGAEHAWLLGRWTYEQLLAHMTRQGGPYKDPLNNTPKNVASGNPEARLEWPNSTLLHGDVPAPVAELKWSFDANLVIMGSGVPSGALMTADLIDEYLLSIAPLVLGTGRRMFPERLHAPLRLTDSMTTSKGVAIATYEPARNSRRSHDAAPLRSSLPCDPDPRSGALAGFYERELGLKRQAGSPPGVIAFDTWSIALRSASRCLGPTSRPGPSNSGCPCHCVP